ncbi:hypothetical protein ACI65C_006519 [Semiaphis heraclei]
MNHLKMKNLISHDVDTDTEDSADEDCLYCNEIYKNDMHEEKWIRCIKCKLHTTKNKLELKTLELNDAMNLLDEKSKDIEDTKLEMQNLKAGMSKLKIAYDDLEEENKIFSSEIIDLKQQLEEMSLSNKAKLLALECIQNDTKKLPTADNVSAHVEDLGRVCCDSWWCPKHSNLVQISKQLKIKTIHDKVEVDMALKRQKYWCKQGQIRCCVFDRKTGADKHTEPPDCWIEYTSNQKRLDLSSFKSLKISNACISSDEDL